MKEKREEKQRRQEEEERQQIEATRSGRAFDREAFLDWYAERMARKQDREELRREQRSSASRAQREEELVTCSFQPRSASPLRLGEIPSHIAHSQASVLRPPTEIAPLTEEEKQANSLLVEQSLKLQALRALTVKEQEAAMAVRREAIDGFELAVEESRRKLSGFVESEEGRAYLEDRARRYAEMNEGMDEEEGMREAHEDLVRATEERLRAHAEAAIRRRVERTAQEILVERLEALHGLIQLHRRMQELRAACGASPPSSLQCFDSQAVDRHSQEQWYLDARELAKLLQQAEAPDVTLAVG